MAVEKFLRRFTAALRGSDLKSHYAFPTKESSVSRYCPIFALLAPTEVCA